MSSTPFNAITYANKLKDAGMSARIADVQAEEMTEIINSELVTKSFLETKLHELELKMIVKLGSFMVVQSGIILAVLGFLIKH